MYASDLKHSLPALEEKLHKLYTLNRAHTIDLSFRPPYLQLLQAFGNPHKNLPPVIHVAGTNGKGSVVAFLREILEQAGYSVHAYTSPHLCAFNERIYLAGKQITDEALEPLVDEALALNKGQSVTFFEITTALSLAAFSRVPADILLLETGLGGRLDCTNIIEKPLLSIITSISWDHMEFLGETLEKIAAEKAGIIKRHAPYVVGPQGSEAAKSAILTVLRESLLINESAGFIHGSEWFIEPKAGRMRFVFGDQVFDLPNPGLVGAHQIGNAGTALAALQVIGSKFKIPQQAMEQGLLKARWPARLQQITSGKLAALLPPGWELWLDGGHNEAAAEVLAAQALAWKEQDAKPLHLGLAMMKHKDPAAFMEALRPHIASATAFGIPGEPAALSPAELARIMGKDIPACAVATDLIGHIVYKNAAPGRILLTGSLYMAGQVLKLCQNKVHNRP